MSIIFGKPLLTIGRKEHYLYRYGNLCIPNSGGWEIGLSKSGASGTSDYFFWQDDNVDITFNSDNIFIDGRNNTDAFKTVSIRNKIDISFRSFSKIEIEYNASYKNVYGIVIFQNSELEIETKIFLLPNSPSDNIITSSLSEVWSANRMIITTHNGNYLTIKSIKLIEK